MASKGQSLTIQYVAWDTDNNAGKTGDVSNHTLRWVKDGSSAAPTNSPSEVDATNAPGVYKITLTAAECDCWVGTLCGKSSTADVSIIPLTLTFEQLPTAAAGTENGLGKCNASGDVVATLDGEKVELVDDAITSAKIATDAINSGKIATTATQEIADMVLARDVSNANPTTEEHSLRFVILQLTESNLTATDGYLTVYDTNGTAIATKAVTTSSSANPITGVT